MEKRKTVKYENYVDFLDDIDGMTLGELQRYVNKLVECHSEADHVKVEWNYENADVYVVANRLETDAEYEARIEKERAAITKKEEQERAKLKELLEKYPDMVKQ